jgi:NADPH:quinone reductase-like Zn-dependent oxidoreductase
MDGRGVGFDFMGKIEAVNSMEFKQGDLVYGTMPPLKGSLKEYVLVPLHQIAKSPSRNLSPIEIAALPLVGLTALQALRDDYKIQPGQHLLVIGASGGVGHVVVQVGKKLGARVTAICSGKNAQRVMQLGADSIVDYQKENIVKQLQEIVLAHGIFHMVFDTVSSHDVRDTQNFDYQRAIINASNPTLFTPNSNGNFYITIGGVTWQWICAGLKRTVGVNLFNVFTPGRELFWIRFPYSTEALNTLTKWAEDGHLKPWIATKLPFTSQGIQEAFEALHSRRVVGKIVIGLDQSLL